MKIEDIERAVFSLRDEEQAKKLRELMKTKGQVAGLSADARFNVWQQLITELPNMDDEFTWLNLLQDLWESTLFECNLFSLQLLFTHPDIVDTHMWNMLDRWTEDIDNWVLADWLGHIRAIAISKSPGLIVRMAPWLQDKNPLRRRTALVSLVYIAPHSGTKELLLQPHEAFAFIEPVSSDEDAVVMPAVAWILSLVRKHFPTHFDYFLEQHHFTREQSVYKMVMATDLATT